MPTTRLSLLGPPQFYHNGQSVALNIAKMQALLAYLAVTRQPQPRDHLLALLWAESGEEAARKNMRNRLWQTRQLLGEETITSQGNSLLLAPDVRTDVAHFETGLPPQLHADVPDPAVLSELLQLWRGPLLEGVTLAEAPEFELWLTTERERLAQLYTQGLDALINHWRQQGDWAQIIALAQRGLQHDPLYEPFHQALMRAYTHRGERTSALRQFDRLQTLLDHELGVAPSADTMALRASIVQNGQDADPANPRDAAEPLARIHPPQVAQPGDQPFIGRQTEIAQMMHAWRQAGAGRCRVLLLSGELGMGKSTLWRQWAATLPAEQIVLETRCLNTTQHLPFDPMRRLLSAPFCRQQMAQVAEKLLPAWRAELVRLAPALQSVLPSAADQAITPPALTPAEERALIAEALTQFLRALEAAPLILFIDDLHWADGATLDWLLYLTDRMAHEPLLVVGAYRPADASAALLQLMAQWQREDILQRIAVPPFTLAETTSLLTTLGSNTAMADYLHHQSGGNPYYLSQLSDVAVDGIPASLVEIVKARLSYLSADAQPILQAAAVLEPAIDLALLQETGGRSEEETVDAIDRLLAAALLTERGDGYEFAHPLVATIVREELSRGRRKLLHRRAADGLAARHAAQLTAVAGQLAHHYGAAGDPEKALLFADMAGTEALHMSAATEALAFFAQAQAIRFSPHRQLEIGMALMLLPGKMAQARATMQEALEAFEAAGDLHGAVKAGLRLAASHLGTQEGAAVLRWASRVLPDLELVEDAELHASAHYLMGTAQYRNGYDMTAAAAHLQKSTELVRTHGSDSEIGIMSWFEWGNLCLERGDLTQAIAKFQQAQRVAQGRQSILFEALSLNNMAHATLLTGAVAQALTLIEQAMQLAETHALQPMRYYFLSTRGEIALASGQADAADDWFNQALTLAQKYDNAVFVANVQAHLGRAAQARGEFDTALALLTTAQNALADTHARHLQIQISLWLADLQIERGQDDAAAFHLQQADAQLHAAEYDLLRTQANQLRQKLVSPSPQHSS
ncbi:MAG: AAA family ATPase [Caldilineaceae bacterium]